MKYLIDINDSNNKEFKIKFSLASSFSPSSNPQK